MKNFSKRKGFTLVELLIVIVVIGVLSAMMMLSSTEAVSSAKAAAIISDLRNVRTAIVSWYTDNSDRIKKESGNDSKYYKIIDSAGPEKHVSEFIEKNSSEFLKYLSGNSSISLKKRGDAKKQGDYTIVGANYSKKWYVCYNVGNDERVKDKLKSRAKSLGLIGSDTVNANNYDNITRSFLDLYL